MADQKQMTEQESLDLITNMIQKAKGSYHETGIGSLLWGTVVTIASVTTYFERTYDFSIGFDIWLIVLAAIIPQIVISIQEKKSNKVKKYEDDALNAVWLVFGITIFGLNIYQIIVPNVTNEFIKIEGWQLTKHYLDNSKADEPISTFTPSIYSLFILIYALPTLVTGIVKKFKPMLYGALITYGLFIWSCFTISEYDFLLGGVAALICWFIPGVILRRKYLAQQKANV
ncbi:hypothetical protein KACHI17_24400 [Sediminibacterium sp. KACHI17]|jgi:hypothetical protein|uniref:Uncharacterized protein n=1 Tax=Sediminibacterium sp. KACHI17 TaxID=1751071 RepID=A0AAT9GLI9_9BACT